MKRILFIATILLSVVGCQSADKSSGNAKNIRSNDSSVKQKNIKIPVTINVSSVDEKLKGIWVIKDSDNGNASFEFTKSDIYYPDRDARYPFHVVGDTIIVKYEDNYIQHMAFKFKGNDTLTLVSEDGPNMFFRVKK